MLRIVHLSDLHLGANDALQRPLFASLVQALRGFKADLVVFTGDIFDSAKLGMAEVERFAMLLRDIDAQVGPNAPTVILPGNHDRRESGILAPVNTTLFAQLAERMKPFPNVQVFGNTPPFLAQVVPLPGFPAHVVAYDSTWLPRGLFSAGGVLRQEDLLQAAERMLDGADDRPLLFLVHHHLVPTPITDVGEIVVEGRGPLVGLLVKHVLPRIVSNADREELTMTALGAGSALTTLHTLGRAVMVLHGHKHYPTARLMKGTADGEGDVMILAAGSCGTSELWEPSTYAEAPRLWPSFNVLELEGTTLRAQSVAFPPEVNADVWRHAPRVNRRPLIAVKREGRRWELDAHVAEPRAFDSSLTLNAAAFTLVKSTRFLDRFDVETTRVVERAPASRLTAYHEVIDGPPRAQVRGLQLDDRPAPDQDTPAQLPLPLNGTARYTLTGGVCTTVEAASRAYDEAGCAFEWVGLLNRYRSDLARVEVSMAPVDVAKQRPFASVTDLTTGRERAVELQRDDAARRYWFEVKQCPAHTMLRIYWPLQSHD